jgi:hypothetical protein
MHLLRQRELALPVAQSVSMTQSQIFSSETTTRCNELQVQLLNGYSLMRDTWPMGARRGAVPDRVNAEQRRRVAWMGGCLQ